MIDEGFTASEIAKKFNLSKQRVSYHICNLKKSGYVNEKERDAFKILTVTQAGKNFVAMVSTAVH
jgi:predicted transcriptional regulator